MFVAESRIEESISKMQLAERDRSKEVANEGKQDHEKVELFKGKKSDFEAQDPLLEVNLGTSEEPRVTKISGLLPEEDRDQLIQLIKKYMDYFARNYHEMLRLS